MSVSEAASRVGKQVYHTGQGQDERARTRPPHLLRGLDSAWSGVSNPHRESGTRWRTAADVGATEPAAGAAHGRQNGCDGNRWGDSVGTQASSAGERPRSAERTQRSVTGQRGCDSGGVLPGRMRKPRRLKGRGVVAGLGQPHAIDDAHPDVGQGADRHTVGLALRAFAPIIVQRPGFLSRRLPGKLVQGVAQGLHAGEACVGFGVLAAFIGHRCRPSQSLDSVSIGIAAAIIAPFCQQTRSQAFARTRQRTPQLLIRMTQKKGADGLVIAGDLLDHHQQLFDQREHQARLGTHDDRARHQLGTVQFRHDLGSHAPRVGMLASPQGGRDLLHRGGQRGLRGGIGLQKHQRGTLLHLGKQVQGRWVVLLEAGRQLVDQARLRLDQRILIARERFQFVHRGAIGLQAAQLGQVEATGLGQQIGINAIGLGACRFAQLIGGLGIDGIDREPRLQQEGNQQAMTCFDNARQLLGRSCNAQHTLFQLVQAVVAVGKASRVDLTTGLIQHHDVMIGYRPSPVQRTTSSYFLS